MGEISDLFYALWFKFVFLILNISVLNGLVFSRSFSKEFISREFVIF